MAVIWTRTAVEALIDIETYIAADNPERAATFVDDIVSKVEMLLPANPQLGRVVSELRKQEIRELVHHRYRIVYRIRDKDLEILTVFACPRGLREYEVEE